MAYFFRWQNLPKMLTSVFSTSAGIDDSNKCVILLEDSSSNAIVTKEFDADPAFPAKGTEVDLGTLDTTHKVLAAGEKLYLSVTNGTTAAPPAFLLQLTYTIAPV